MSIPTKSSLVNSSYSNYADNPERRAILLSGAHVKRRKYSPPPPKRFVLDIGKEISLQMLAEQYGFGGAE